MNILEYMYVYIYTYLFAYIYTYGKATQATQQSKIQFSSKSYISLQFGECIHLGFATLFTFPHGHPHDFTVSGPVKPPIPSSQQSPRDGNWSWISHDYPWVSHWSIIQWHNPNASAIIITKWFFFHQWISHTPHFGWSHARWQFTWQVAPMAPAKPSWSIAQLLADSREGVIWNGSICAVCYYGNMLLDVTWTIKY
jgi:hypothetical protein